NLPMHPLVLRVVDPLMSGVLVLDAAIRAVRVGVDRLRVAMHHVREEALHGLAGGIRGHAKPDLASALDRAEYDGFVVEPVLPGLARVLVGAGADLAADVSLVGFHDP